MVDNEGEEIFADKVGVMLARDISALHPGATFVADVKSTGLFMTDPVLSANGAKADYWKTGHSYIKRRVNELGALAGFEKSGHYFFNKPIGRGYDDGLIFALAILDMLDRNPGKSMADLQNALPKTWGSPTMSPHCDDEKKYGVVDKVVKHFEATQAKGEKVAGQPIRDLVTVNGVRVTVEDGTWGLVRASSNKPELVVVVESPVSEARMREMFKAVDAVLRRIRKSAPTTRRSDDRPSGPARVDADTADVQLSGHAACHRRDRPGRRHRCPAPLHDDGPRRAPPGADPAADGRRGRHCRATPHPHHRHRQPAAQYRALCRARESGALHRGRAKGAGI